MRIAHLTVVRKLTDGQTKQLYYEQEASKKLLIAKWTTLAFHNGNAEDVFIKRIPLVFQALFFRNLYGWIIALKLSREYDFVLMRHMTFDPFAFLFAPLINNFISIHHAKEIEELQLIRKGWRGRAASKLEKVSGRVVAQYSLMILGVTREIAQYQKDIYSLSKLIGAYPNGVDLDKIELLGDSRKQDEVNVAFICGTFSRWHGLDRLIKAVEILKLPRHLVRLKIHLIGQLSDVDKIRINATEVSRGVFKIYGRLSEAQYRPVLEKCDFGIASLAMDRQHLTEGSTLKVREMLAMGLSVYSGHRDIAVPEYEAFVRISSYPNVREMIDFGLNTKSICRLSIRHSSSSRIDKLAILKSLVFNLRKNFST
jgi:glycosyltransferase involved in cell wall biosynthesis